MSHPINWFHISTKDVKGAQKFYKSVFGWKMSAGPGGTIMVAPEKGGIPGGIGEVMPGQSSNAAIYAGSEKLEADLKKVEKAGGRVVMPPMDLPPGMGRIAGFMDPEGVFIGLWEAGKPAKKAKKGAKKAKKAGKKK